MPVKMKPSETRKSYISIEIPKTKHQTLKAVILYCYNINKWRGYSNLNVQLVAGETLIKKIKKQIKYLDFLDRESETYKSLYSLGKKTLEEELKTGKYLYWYHYIIHYICDLDLEKIASKRSKSVDFYPTEKKRNQDYKSRFIEPEAKFIAARDGEVIVNPKYTGRQYKKDLDKQKNLEQNLDL